VLGGSALIVGLARDCAVELAATLPRLDRLNASFDELKYVVVTNDSADHTPALLQKWSQQRTNARIIELSGLSRNVPTRSARLAVCRNICLSEWKRDIRSGCSYDYLIVLDLDGLNANLIDEPNFSAAILAAPQEWGGLFANQRDKYYDIWALRHSEWCPNDCWQEVSIYTKRFPILRKRREKIAIARYVRSRAIHIPPDSAPIQVQSAFGGFAVYRPKYLRDAYYLGLTHSGDPVCEHVPFHEMIRANGAKLYILPSLLNDSPAEHSPDI
jgi:glycosyltransferase involved in cell wall biosynthesis